MVRIAGTVAMAMFTHIWLFGVMHSVSDDKDKDSWLSSAKIRNLFPETDQIIRLSDKYPSAPYERRSIISKIVNCVGPCSSKYLPDDYDMLIHRMVGAVEDAVESHSGSRGSHGGMSMNRSGVGQGQGLTGLAFVSYCYTVLHEIVLGMQHKASIYTNTAINTITTITTNVDTATIRIGTENPANTRDKTMSMFDTATANSTNTVYGHSTFRKYHCKLEIGVLLYGPPGKNVKNGGYMLYDVCCLVLCIIYYI